MTVGVISGSLGKAQTVELWNIEVLVPNSQKFTSENIVLRGLTQGYPVCSNEAFKKRSTCGLARPYNSILEKSLSRIVKARFLLEQRLSLKV